VGSDCNHGFEWALHGASFGAGALGIFNAHAPNSPEIAKGGSQHDSRPQASFKD